MLGRRWNSDSKVTTAVIRRREVMAVFTRKMVMVVFRHSGLYLDNEVAMVVFKHEEEVMTVSDNKVVMVIHCRWSLVQVDRKLVRLMDDGGRCVAPWFSSPDEYGVGKLGPHCYPCLLYCIHQYLIVSDLKVLIELLF